MLSRPLAPFAFLAAFSLSVGCGEKLPAEVPEELNKMISPKAEEKPPPKCEKLSEKCKAKGKTRAKIANSELGFVPVAGWAYAQGAETTLTQESDGGSAFAILAYDIEGKDAKADAAKRDAAFAALLKQLALEAPKKKVNWKKGDDTKTMGELEVGFWELAGGARGEKKGPLLVIHASVDDETGLLGIGFVPDDDQSSASEAMIKSIESIAPMKQGKSK